MTLHLLGAGNSREGCSRAGGSLGLLSHLKKPQLRREQFLRSNPPRRPFFGHPQGIEAMVSLPTRSGPIAMTAHYDVSAHSSLAGAPSERRREADRGEAVGSQCASPATSVLATSWRSAISSPCLVSGIPRLTQHPVATPEPSWASHDSAPTSRQLRRTVR